MSDIIPFPAQGFLRQVASGDPMVDRLGRRCTRVRQASTCIAHAMQILADTVSDVPERRATIEWAFKTLDVLLDSHLVPEAEATERMATNLWNQHRGGGDAA